jgi:hypothetical protein
MWGDYMKIYITAQALQKSEIETTLATRMEDLIEHLLKLYLMPNSSARNHWQGEIYGILHSISKLKQSKKYPSSNMIYNWTYKKVRDLVTDYKWMKISIDDFCDQYEISSTESVSDIMNEFDGLCVEYFTWLSEKLSTAGKLSTRDVYNKLNELF